MPSCAVKWCGKHSKTSSYKKDGITFHRFPKNAVMKEIWIKATHRDNFFPGKDSVICSRHFTADCFEYLKYRRRLYISSVPTLYLPSLIPSADPSISQEQPSSSKNIKNGSSTSTASPQHKPDWNVADPSAPGPSHSTVGTPDTSDLGGDNDDDNTTEQKFELIDDTLEKDEYYIPTATHIGYVCSACGNRIDGFRYACMQCADYDQCAECEASGAHAEHYVLRVPRVERAAELQTVLDRVRRELKQVTIPVLPNQENDDDEEISVIIKEEVMDPEEVDPLQCAGVGVGGDVVKQEVIDPEDSDTTTRGQVPVYETAGVRARVPEASSTRPRRGKTSNIQARVGKASGSSAPGGPAGAGPGGGVGTGGGAGKQEAIDSDDATGVPSRAYEASSVRQRAAKASRRRAPASEPVNTPAPTEDSREQPRDSERQAGGARDGNLSELSTFLRFDSMRAPRKRRKTEELGD